MRGKWLLAGLLVVVVGCLWMWKRGDSGRGSADGTQGGTALELSPAAIDFGRVMVGESVEEIVVARNAGDRPLEGALEIDAPFRASRHSLELGPNESREVLVGLSPREPGALAGALRFAPVGAEADQGAAVQLSAVAHLPGRAQVSPLLLRFGVVEVGQVVESEFEIRNAGADVLRVSGLGVTAPFALPDQVSDELELAPGEQRYVRVEFRPVQSGDHRRLVLLRTSDPEEPQFQITLVGAGSEERLYPEAEVDREALDFGEVMVGRERDLSIQVRNVGSDPLRLSRIVVAAPFSVPQRSREIPPGRAYMVPVTYAPTEFGASRERLRIFTNDPAHSELAVELDGLGSAAGGGRAARGASPGAGGGTLLDEQGELPSDSPLLDPDFDPEPVEAGVVAIGTYDAEIGPEHVSGVVFDPKARELHISDLQLPDVVAAGDQRFAFDPVDVRLTVDANGEISGRVPVTVRNSLGNDESLWIDFTTGEMTVQTKSGSLAVQGEPLGPSGQATLVGQVPGGYLDHNLELVLRLTARGVGQ